MITSVGYSARNTTEFGRGKQVLKVVLLEARKEDICVGKEVEKGYLAGKDIDCMPYWSW